MKKNVRMMMCQDDQETPQPIEDAGPEFEQAPIDSDIEPIKPPPTK